MTLRSRICDSISPISSRSVHLHRVARTTLTEHRRGSNRSTLKSGPTCVLQARLEFVGLAVGPPTGEPRVVRTSCGLRSRASTTDTYDRSVANLARRDTCGLGAAGQVG